MNWIGWIVAVVAILFAIWQTVQLSKSRSQNQALEHRLERAREKLNALREQLQRDPPQSQSDVERLAEAGFTLDPTKLSEQALRIGFREARGALSIVDRLTGGNAENRLPPATVTAVRNLIQSGDQQGALRLIQKTVAVSAEQAKALLETISSDDLQR